MFECAKAKALDAGHGTFRRCMALPLYPISQVRTNRNQMTGIMNTAKETIAANTNSTDRPALAWRTSVGVSMVIPCFFSGIELSALRLGQG
jgi:hypothetical protein